MTAESNNRTDDEVYGQTLTETLFGPDEVRAAFEGARQNAEALDAPLRVRLFIGPRATARF